MKTTMILPRLAAALAVCWPPAGAIAATVSASTPPAGYIPLAVAGSDGSVAGALSFLGLGLTRPPRWQGTLSSANGPVVTDSAATWADDAYNGANGPFYLELTSGSGVGLTSQITATNGNSKSLTLADDLSAYVASGVTYTVRPNWTLAGLFGAVDEKGLGGGSATTADQVLVYNSLTRKYATYYYKTTSFPAGSGTGWRSTASTSADASSAPFHPYDGILVRRYQTGLVDVTLEGAVKLGTSDLPVNAGLNILSNVYPGGTFTLGTSGLYTGSTTTGLLGGSLTTADQVLIFNAASGTYSTYYYKTTTFPPGTGTGWRSTASPKADASTTPLPIGSSVLVQRVANSPFEWIAPQPFTLP